jgi:hypothetical protein
LLGDDDVGSLTRGGIPTPTLPRKREREPTARAVRVLTPFV